MFIEGPAPVPADFAERWPNWFVDDAGMPHYRQPKAQGVIHGRWIACDNCGGIAPAIPYNKGRYCSQACAYADRKGAKHPNWTGGRSTERSGYVRINPPDGERMLEHRYVMEQQLGRPLQPHEHVHHRDGKRDNNDPANLELWIVLNKRTHPVGVRAADYALDLLKAMPPAERAALFARLNAEQGG